MSNELTKYDSQIKALAQTVETKNDFKKLVNKSPKKEWVKVNKFANNSNYIPIGIVETMMQTLFLDWKVEITGQGTAFNSVWVTVRVHFQDLQGVWSCHDGIGACELQTKKDSSPAQLENINHGAVMMAFPMAKSYAIKDACEHIGRLFGRDLNRKDVLEYKEMVSISQTNENKERQRILDGIHACRTGIELESFRMLAEQNDLMNEFNEQFNKML